ncbi:MULTISPECIES: oxidoreductase [Halomonadaceae]|nr:MULTISPECIES: oxidoreductase [Halomonas]QJQ97133.1 oxidoreductase [Halomonas sp. PA5]
MMLSVALTLESRTALALPQPEGDVILTVTGAIERTNVNGEAQFDHAMLMELNPHVVETHTPWLDGLRRYEGPLGRTLLDTLEAQGETLTIQALDGFSAEVPVSDFYDYDVILALTLDGEPMPIRDSGPIFILYPFDEHPELLNMTIRFRSVWQVANIHVN